MKNIILDDEEKELLQSLETEEWVSVDNLEKEIKKHQAIAKNRFFMFFCKKVY